MALLVAGCVIGAHARPTTRPTPSPPIAVIVSTAPGDRLAFDPAEVPAPAGRPLLLTFRNGSSVPHNLVFTTGIKAATDTIVEPGEVQELSVGPLEAGIYRFVCTIHEEMRGALTVRTRNS